MNIINFLTDPFGTRRIAELEDDLAFFKESLKLHIKAHLNVAVENGGLKYDLAKAQEALSIMHECSVELEKLNATLIRVNNQLCSQATGTSCPPP